MHCVLLFTRYTSTLHVICNISFNTHSDDEQDLKHQPVQVQDETSDNENSDDENSSDVSDQEKNIEISKQKSVV